MSTLSAGAGGLPEGWAWAALEETLSCEARAITDGPFGSNLKSAHYTDSGARVIRLQNVGDGEFRDERAYISLEHFETLRAHEAREGDLLLASLGEKLPRVALMPKLDEPAIVKADVIRARPHSEIHAKWLLYALRAPQTQSYAGGLIKGVGRPRLGMAAMRQIPIPVPPLAEQHRIVEALEEQLSRLDAARESAARSLKRMDALGSNLLTASLSSVTKVARLKDVLASPLINGRSVKTLTGGFPVLRLTALKDGRIDLGEFKEGAWDSVDARPFLVKKDDFLISRGNGSIGLVGRGGLVGIVEEGVAFPDTMIRVRADAGSIMPEFLSLIWGTRVVRRQIEGSARTTAGIYKVNQQILESIEFPLPSLEEQRAIVRRRQVELSQMDAVRTSAEHALRRSRSLERALLRKAFTGNLLLQNPADEPATTLLARITAERDAAKPARTTKRTMRPRKTTAAATEAPPAPTSAPVTSVQQELFQ
ncbi:restriction endonuclease subunit S [Streptomyces sp. NPDC054765]